MENKDFDKIFAHKFNQIPGEPYHEEGWSDLSGRMDAHGVSAGAGCCLYCCLCLHC
ncbi:MAG: hypothetical protein IPL27_12775 [Lewinellaceae bacterium]|nr:hypothetical protein [Lewinellaceae bacterium]